MCVNKKDSPRGARPRCTHCSSTSRVSLFPRFAATSLFHSLGGDLFNHRGVAAAAAAAATAVARRGHLPPLCRVCATVSFVPVTDNERSVGDRDRPRKLSLGHWGWRRRRRRRLSKLFAPAQRQAVPSRCRSRAGGARASPPELSKASTRALRCAPGPRPPLLLTGVTVLA